MTHSKTNLREVFVPGQRVELSRAGIDAGFARKRARVTRMHPNGEWMDVRIGTVGPEETYWVGYWKLSV